MDPVEQKTQKYIQKLERRIHNQRIQLSWWQSQFECNKLHRPVCWTIQQVNDLLRRLGGTHKVMGSGELVRPVCVKRRKASE